MKNVTKSTLLGALEKVQPGLSNREVVEQSAHVAFNDGMVVTYNDEISVTHSCPELKGITGAVVAEKLYAFLKKIRKEEIELEVSGNELLLRSGRSRAGFTLSEEINMPLDELDMSGKWGPIPEWLMNALSFCKFSCSNDRNIPLFQNVHVGVDESGKGFAESCDNYRFTRVQGGDMPFKPFLIPLSALRELEKYEMNEMEVTDTWIHFRSEGGTIFSCRVHEEEYPDISELINTRGDSLKLPKTLDGVLERAAVFAEGGIDVLEDRVELKLKKNRMVVRSEGPGGWFEEEVNLRHKKEPVSCAVKPQTLRDIVGKIQTCEFTDRLIRFEGENWVHLVVLLQE